MASSSYGNIIWHCHHPHMALSSSSYGIIIIIIIIGIIIHRQSPPLKMAATSNTRGPHTSETHHYRHFFGVFRHSLGDSRMHASATAFSRGSFPKCYIAVRIFRVSPKMKIRRKNHAASFSEKSDRRVRKILEIRRSLKAQCLL